MASFEKTVYENFVGNSAPGRNLDGSNSQPVANLKRLLIDRLHLFNRQ
ncbi:hypothetical protein DEHRE_08885 [Dehalobacter restrictus DSM 9455]|jgi:hypothetical protein|uniref:Uncharacterized protein n=1 Tax=Dehalobacter restrictus (strain DSM 9455 / PER-K23) TaxID=871738 RepID=A0ABM5PAM4_DEHRP|nr:hypothetical protein DEHRE_08885 [Dehalobacter restrictus DSM 9455]